jgi:hypothetical protein
MKSTNSKRKASNSILGIREKEQGFEWKYRSFCFDHDFRCSKTPGVLYTIDKIEILNVIRMHSEFCNYGNYEIVLKLYGKTHKPQKYLVDYFKDLRIALHDYFLGKENFKSIKFFYESFAPDKKRMGICIFECQ